MALYTDLTLKLVATLTASGDLGTPTYPIDNTTRFNWGSGTGADQADKLWSDTNTLAASGTTDVDLAGPLADGLGGTITFVKLKALIVKANPANTNNVVVSRPAANGVPLFAAASDAIPVLPGGLFAWVSPGAGITVTTGTGDLITLTNSAGATGVIYDLIVIGTSA